jgi:molybdopterin/thiamine biosynthesis adenylyltransferase
MDDSQLLRYSRHILLEELGVEGQEKLLSSQALVIGAGGLGSPVALYLGSAGVGRITVVDHDTVDATNLQRQIAHSIDRIGQFKADSIRQAVAQINPDPVVNAVTRRADAQLLAHWVATSDVVIDCSDNFATRHAVNAACVQGSKPLVSGAAIRMDGQVSVFDSRHQDAPCYACVFPADQMPEETRCATLGVFAPLVGIIGSMQAAEALKILAGMGSHLPGRLLMLDGRSLSWTDIRIQRDPACLVCGKRPNDA